MASNLMRRSGLSACLIAELLQWTPDSIYQIGIGLNCEEIVVFKDAWPNAFLFGCEPHPKIYEGLGKKYYGTLYPFGISDHDGSATMYYRGNHKDGSTLNKPDNMRGVNECTIKLRTLDSLFEDGPPTNKTLLWLDCEGSELAALRGATEFIKRVEMVNVEMTARPISKQWCSSNEVHDWLIDHGFKRQWVHTSRLSAGQCDGIYVRPYLFRPEYCCCPCQMESGR